MKLSSLLLFCLLALPLVSIRAEESGNSQTTNVETLVWPDGTRYVGGVVDGKRSGKGTIFWQDGTRFVGTFKNDKRNGPGTMILPNGKVYSGYFKNDKLVPAPEDKEPGVSTKTAPREPPLPTAKRAPQLTPVTELTDDIKERLKQTIHLWAAAWSEQNVTQYLDYYSDDFEIPKKYASLDDWKAVRRSRLTHPEHIRIHIDYHDFRLVRPNVVDVTFHQVYKSDVYSDVTIKTLRLRKEGPGWKILFEHSITLSTNN